MEQQVIESLDELIGLGDGAIAHKRNDIPQFTTLSAGGYLREKISEPSHCIMNGCRARCTVERRDGMLTVECDEGHIGSTDVETRTNYKISYEAVLRGIGNLIDLTITEYDHRHLPRYALAKTDEGIAIYLVVAPRDYTDAIHQICIDTLATNDPAILVTPEETVSDILDIQSLYAIGSLLYTVPFIELTEPESVKHQLNTMSQIQTFEDDIVSNRFKEDLHPVVKRVNANSRYILTELNHMKLLRRQGELPPGDGTRLEKVGESAFGHLFPTLPGKGGQDDIAENLPDNVFYIPKLVDDQIDYASVLGVVDTKSGGDANFAKEKVRGKHDEYLRRGRSAAVPADALAHIFLVLDIDGQQELKFYDKMSDHYRENEYMVVIMIDAFMTIMAAYLSHVVANELQLSKGDFRKAIYPLLHRDTFNNSDLGTITRDVGQNADEYEQQYLQRPGLMVLTKDLVLTHFEAELDQEGDIERILQAYY